MSRAIRTRAAGAARSFRRTRLAGAFAAMLAMWGAGAVPACAQTEPTGQPAGATGTADPASATDPAAAVGASAAEAGTEPGADADGAASPPRHARPPATGVDAQLQRLASDLGLDSGQQERIRPVLMAHREELERLKRDAHLAPAERQRRILALGDRTADQIRAQLNDDQRARYIKPRAAAATPRPNAGKDVKR